MRAQFISTLTRSALSLACLSAGACKESKDDHKADTPDEKLEAKAEQVGEKLEAKADKAGEKLEAKAEQVGEKFDEVGARLKDAAAKLEGETKTSLEQARERLAGLDERLAKAKAKAKAEGHELGEELEQQVEEAKAKAEAAAKAAKEGATKETRDAIDKLDATLDELDAKLKSHENP